MTSSAPTASSATTTASATASSSMRSAAAVRTPTARAPSASKPVASQERRSAPSQSQRADGGGRGQPQVDRLQRDQRAEQQPVDARAGLVDVAGQHHADRQRGDQQQPDRGVGIDPARALHPLEHAAEADRAHQRGELRRDAPRARRRPGPGTSRCRSRACRTAAAAARPTSRARPRSPRAAGSRRSRAGCRAPRGQASTRQSTAPPLKPSTSARVLDSIEPM